MKYEMMDDTLQLFLEGHIDSNNAEQTEKEINEIIAQNSCQNILIDAEGLEYISSAGLRVLLRLRKKFPKMEVVNVRPEVYEVFDMTGFTEMITIRKGYRRVSVEGCEVIGQGANGRVYRIDPDTIVKEYFNPDALPEIQRERELARTAFVLGIPTAIPYDVVRVGNGYGSVFELLNAKSFAQLLISGEKTVDEIAKMSIDLLKQIHSTVVKPDSMPDMKDVALGWADFMKDYLAPELYQKLRSLVEAVPEDYHMMHGDYHLKNVMLQNDEVLLIDMDTLSYGHPVFELASMYNAYCGYSELDHQNCMNFLGIPYETACELWKKSLMQYLGTEDPDRIKEVEEKAQIIGYTRIVRRTIRRNGLNTEEGRAVIENGKKYLERLLPKTETLVF